MTYYSNNSNSSPKKLRINWSEDVYANQPITSDVEDTWILQKTISIPSIAEFNFKIGNKDYYLQSTAQEGEYLSELTLKKRYR